MNKDIIYQAALTTTKATPVDYLLARFFGKKATIQFQERRRKSRRKNSAMITVDHCFILSDYNNEVYLLDKRVKDRCVSVD